MNRGLPIEVAMDPGTMLVFGMNGEPLTPGTWRASAALRTGMGRDFGH